MAKSSSKVRPLIKEKWDNEKYVVRFNIVEVEDVDAEAIAAYKEFLNERISLKQKATQAYENYQGEE